MEATDPYEKYRHVGFNVGEFIKFTWRYPEAFDFCSELAIAENGLIFLASPSHEEISIWLTKKGFKNICLVWYEGWECAHPSKSQEKVIARLEKEKLIQGRRFYGSHG